MSENLFKKRKRFENCIVYQEKNVCGSYDCFGGYIIDSLIGTGGYGWVYQIKDKFGKIGDIVMKIQVINSKTITEFKNEVAMTKRASDKNYGAKFFDSGICSELTNLDPNFKIGYILIGYMDITLRDYELKFPKIADSNKKVLKQLFIENTKRMLSDDIDHLDLYDSNVMLNLDKNMNVIELKFIDWSFFENLPIDTDKDYLLDLNLALLAFGEEGIWKRLGGKHKPDEYLSEYSKTLQKLFDEQ